MANSGSFNTSKYESAYLTFIWNIDSQDTANNQTVINWSLKGAGIQSGYWYMAGNFKVVINGVTVYQSSNRIKLYTGTVVAQGKLAIQHDSNGNKNFSASAEAGIYTVDVNVNGSGSWDLPNIPQKAYITNAFNFTDVENPKFQYKNPAGNSVDSLMACISFDGKGANINYRNVPKDGQSYSFNLTEAEREQLRIQLSDKKSATLYILLKMVLNGKTNIASSPVVCTIVDASPTFNCSYKDTNQATLAITEDNRKIIQSKSNLIINLDSISAKKHTRVYDVSLSLNGVTYSGSFNSDETSATIEVGAVNISSDIIANVTVTDKRGYSTTKALEISILPWDLPTAVIKVQRDSNYYSDCTLSVNADYALLNNQNTITIEYRIAPDDTSSWSNFVRIGNNSVTDFTADNTRNWKIQVMLADRLGSATYNINLPKGVPIIYFDRKKQSVGINCFPKNEGSLEINGKTIFDMVYPVGAIYLSVNSASPSTLFGGSWEQIQDRFLLGAGATYSAGSLGGEAAHTLTIDEMPRHNHEIDNLNSSGNSTPYMTVQAQDRKGYGGNVQTMFAGGSQPHNNMPPYLAVYIWKRVS